MEPPKKSYKKALTSTHETGEAEKVEVERKSTSKTSSKAAEADEVIEALLSSDSAEEAYDDLDSSDGETGEKEMNMEEYLKHLYVVRQDVKKFTEACLLGIIWNGQVEIKKLEAKLIADWKFMKGEVKLVDRTNFWFEIQFANPSEKGLVWENRPYYVFGNLLVITHWRPNFDPTTARIERLDLWIRIPFLLAEYMSPEMIKAIIKYNKIGKFIKLDPFSELRLRAKYARVCVSVINAPELKGYVEVPDYDGNMKDYHVWYENISDGCGYCGEEDHTFEICPFRTSSPKIPKIVVAKSPRKTGISSSAPSTTKEDESVDEMGKQWMTVADTKGKKPKILRKPTKQKIVKPNPAGRGIVIREPIHDVYEGSSTKGKKLKEEVVGAQKLKAVMTYDAEEEEGSDDADLQPITPPVGQPSKTPKGKQQDLDKDDLTDNSVYKSLQSDGSVIHKLHNMGVQRDEKDGMSVSDPGKRKQGDFDADTASSSVKRSKPDA